MILAEYNTWPSLVREFFENNTEALYNIKYDTKLVEEIKGLYGDAEIRGWHCSRLTVREVHDIEKKGLSPLSKDMLNARIDTLIDDGIIDMIVATKLKSEDWAFTGEREEQRINKTYFYLVPPKIEGDPSGYFRYWGGEVLSYPFDCDNEMKAVLVQIGEPALIEAEIALKDLADFDYLVETSAIYFLAKEDLTETFRFGCNNDYIVRNLPASQIRKIYSPADPEFEELSGCKFL